MGASGGARMKRYEIITQTADGRVWTIIIKADGFRESGDTVTFYQGAWPFRKPIHIVKKSQLVSAGVM